MQENWSKKSRLLTQALILSGALNIGLLTSFFYFISQKKQSELTFEMPPLKSEEKKLTNGLVLAGFAEMSYPELVDLLESQEVIEEGYKKRDLALASLVTFHCIDLEKALQGIKLSKRTFIFQRKEGPEQVEISLYPGLTEDQFQAVIHFIKTEKFPFTTQALFYELQNFKSRDPSLHEAFYLTSEFSTVMTLFSHAGIPLPSNIVMDLILQGDWRVLHQLNEEQKQARDLSPLRLKMFLLSYIKMRSSLAAKILLEWDRDFILKNLEDTDLMVFIELFPQKTDSYEQFLKQVLASPRSDAVWKKASDKLQIKLEPSTETAAAATTIKKHTVQPGDNLWKLARKYKVSVQSIKDKNYLESDKLKVGKEIVIPTKDSP